ncbi:hypothetical protein SAMN05216326_11268 [Nitrosomonas marina]|uniref:DUF6677 domain-containing protein n=1 Tax=Nitrosomonas marina TaxID=917 RepID=A0A1I0BZN1_9PROT|nr:DUF6677 family protein [Nitrosomonas marina]SET12032.1 hypothetical protein SAMN05216326_11268 [Nitrosomonas marina]
MTGQGSGGNVLAAICSFLIPGLGQLVQGRALSALLFFVVVSTNYFFAALIIPAVVGGIIHLWSILDAAKFNKDD